MRLLFVLLLTAISTRAAGPERIVSTGPAITEILFALGLGDRVAGVSTYCNYPAAARSKPRIGTYLDPNVEVIASLRPDLVIVEKLPNKTVPLLGKLRLKTLEVSFGGFAANLSAMERIAAACGAGPEGSRLVNGTRARFEAVRRRHAAQRRPAVAFIVGRAAGSLEALVAAGGGSLIHDMIEAAGGRNIFAGSRMPYFRTSLEAMAGAAPDVIIDMGEMADTAGFTQARRDAIVALWRHAPLLRARPGMRVLAVSSDAYVVPGPRMADAAEELGALLHPGGAR